VLVTTYLIPFYGVVTLSLKSMNELSSNYWGIPRDPIFENFKSAWSYGLAGVGKYLINSFKMTIPAVIISVFFSALLSFAITKMNFRFGNLIYYIMIFGLAIPVQILVIPIFYILNSVHLYNSIAGLVWVHSAIGIAFCTFILRNFMKSIPDELLESAKIDGCNMFNIFFRIILPLSITGIIVVTIFQFTFIYNELFFGLALTADRDVFPVTVGIAVLKGEETLAIRWPVQAAAALIASIPTIVLFLALQRYFMRGIMAGAIKE